MRKSEGTVMVSYQEVYEQLRDDIRNGTFVGKLPSIADFTKKYRVSHNTIKKVLDRMKAQHFIYGMQGKGVFVNDAALHSPAFQKNIVFYLHIDTYRNPFFLKAFSRLRQMLEEHQSIVQLVTSPRQLSEISENADVVISSISENEERLAIESLVDSRKIIFFNTNFKDSHCVNTDNVLGGYLAMEYLYRQGHRKIGLISRDLKIKGCYFDLRHQGCLQFAAEHPDLVLVNSEMKINLGVDDEFCARQATIKLFKTAPDITAVFAFTDILALGVVSYCHENDIRIPAEVSLIGFDNRDFSSMLSPPLTTVQENTEELIRLVMDRIDSVVCGDNDLDIITVAPFLVERDSVRTI